MNKKNTIPYEMGDFDQSTLLVKSEQINLFAFLFGPFHMLYHQFWSRFVELYMIPVGLFFISMYGKWAIMSLYKFGDMPFGFYEIGDLCFYVVKWVSILFLIVANVLNGLTFNRKYYTRFLENKKYREKVFGTSVGIVWDFIALILLMVVTSQLLVPSMIANHYEKEFKPLQGSIVEVFYKDNNTPDDAIEPLSFPSDISMSSKNLHELLLGTWTDTDSSISFTKNKIDDLSYKVVKNKNKSNLLNIKIGDEKFYIYFISEDSIVLVDEESVLNGDLDFAVKLIRV